MTTPRIDRYDWGNGGEAMLRFGPADGPVVVVVAPPLFEEANRTRAFIVAILRALAARGISGVLPDLPGQGESLVPTDAATLPDWRHAFAAAIATAGSDAHVVALRGGALLTHEARARSRWLFAPLDGEALVRDLFRAARMGERDAADDATALDDPGPPLTFAGNAIARPTLRQLRDAVPDAATPARLVRLDTDPLPADRHVAGPPLWRRSEPGVDAALAALLADDIAAWIARCGR